MMRVMKPMLGVWVILMLLGCRSVVPPLELDRAVVQARAAVEKKYPPPEPDAYRLSEILPLDRTSATSRVYMVVFEDRASIQVTTNDNVRQRKVRHLDAHVQSDGRITSVGESWNSSSGRSGK